MRALAAAGIVLALGCGRAAPAPIPPGPGVVAVPESPTGAPDDDASAWQRLPPPRPGDWRSRYPDETAMSFEEYVRSEPVRADGARRTLAFLPVGGFGTQESATLDAAAEFAGLWFDLPVRVLDAVPLTEDPAQRRDNGGVLQVRTNWFLHDLLPDRLPDDAAVLLGVTMTDVWPGRGWNYVFGQADLRRRVGVWSLARYFPEFWDLPRDEASLRLALLRTLKVVVHEAGHAFGLEHCATWLCAMNGSNSLDETDGQPLLLCPDCGRKLAWNRGYDERARHGRLAEFLGRHGLAAEAAWHRARAAGR